MNVVVSVTPTQYLAGAIIRAPFRVAARAIRRFPIVAFTAALPLGMALQFATGVGALRGDAAPRQCFAQTTDGRLASISCMGAVVELKSLKVVSGEEVLAATKSAPVAAKPSSTTKKGRLKAVSLAVAEPVARKPLVAKPSQKEWGAMIDDWDPSNLPDFPASGK